MSEAEVFQQAHLSTVDIRLFVEQGLLGLQRLQQFADSFVGFVAGVRIFARYNKANGQLGLLGELELGDELTGFRLPHIQTAQLLSRQLGIVGDVQGSQKFQEGNYRILVDCAKTDVHGLSHHIGQRRHEDVQGLCRS